jgi:hypothetical protein
LRLSSRDDVLGRATPRVVAGAEPETHKHNATMRRRQLLHLTLIAGLGPIGPWALLASPRVFAAELEGVRFEERITLGGRDLLLNGIGLRAAGWFKLYVAALYLQGRASTAEQALGQAGPKRLRVVMLREAPAVELAKAVDKGVNRNAGPAGQEALRERLGQLTEQMRIVRDVKAGDTVDFDHEPARGTLMLLNGKPRGPAISGSDFYAAVLRSFIGEHPYHRDLRAGLLGQPAAKPS